MSEYFSEPKYSGWTVNVELGLSNFVIKAAFKNATRVETSTFAKKIDLANLKSNEDKLDVGKLKKVSNSLSSSKSKVDKLNIGILQTTSFDLMKLSDVVKK